MKFREIKVGELEDFISSSWYRNQEVVPITPQRAISQALNPSATSNDVALILALGEQEQLLGFVGILPACFHSPEKEKYFYNTGWWVHPDRGKQVAMPLFYRMLQVTANRMVFVDLTPHTAILLEQTGWFIMQSPTEGAYVWFFSGLRWLPKRRGGWYQYLAPVFSGPDAVANVFLSTRHGKWHKFLKIRTIHIEEVRDFDPETIRMMQHPGKINPVARTVEELRWIKHFPWIILRKNAGKRTKIYPFSWLAHQFEQKFLRFSCEGNVCGAAMITFRDGVAKIPYLFMKKGYEETVPVAVLSWISRQPVHGLISWNSHILRAMETSGFPVLIRKKVLKRTAFSRSLRDTFSEGLVLQDGDGDMAFT